MGIHRAHRHKYCVAVFSACVQTDLKYINAYIRLYSSLRHGALRDSHAHHQCNDRRQSSDASPHGLMTALFLALIGMIY